MSSLTGPDSPRITGLGREISGRVVLGQPGAVRSRGVTAVVSGAVCVLVHRGERNDGRRRQ